MIRKRSTWTLRSGNVEPIQIHDFVPRRHEVSHELLLRIVTCVDFRKRAELRVRTEHKVDPGAGPFDLAGAAISTLVDVFSRSGSPPLGTHVEEVDEEVVGQRPR